MSSRRVLVLMSCVVLFGVQGLDAGQPATAPGGPLSQLVGEWSLTAFVIGAGQFGGPRCGKTDRPGPASVTIELSREDGVSLGVACDDGSDYAFRLKRDAASQDYLITVKSKVGLSVNDFPVAYVEGEGWKGARPELVEGKEVSVTATIARIEGRNWVGWAITVVPSADIKTPYFRVDLTRRK